ncbi:MAG TPA: winged helix DNA-binding domain-containing protein [Gaiellales bacterium]
MPVETLSVRALNRATLARQLLLARAPISVAEGVDRLAGLQAQEAKPPFIGLWSRLEGFERDQLAAAIRAREIVRATWLRGTLHLVGAADYAAFRETVRPVLEQGLRLLGDRAAGLDVDAVLPLARTLLQAGPRTFGELRGELQQAFPEVNERALGFTVRMLMPLVMEPTDDAWAFRANARFTPADEWIGRPLAASDARGELVLRYLAAFGPATAADVQAWSGLKGVAATIAELRPALVELADERGRTLHDLPDAPRPGDDVPAPARLLPEFDNLVLAHADRTRIVPDAYRGEIVTKNLRVRATFLWDGFVAGTWTSSVTRKAATLELAPFTPLPARAIKALSVEAEALLRFLEPDAVSFAVRAS